jgi:tetratricopeptide (TPR) repeat protein
MEMLDVDYKKVRNRSIRSGVISLLGIIIFISSLIYASINLKNSNKEITVQKSQIDSLFLYKNRLVDSINQVRQQLINSRNASRYISVGINNFHAKDYAAAVDAYDKAIQLDSLNPVIFDLRGYSLFMNKRYDEAIISLKRSVRIDPTYSWGYYDLSLALWAKGLKSESIKAIEKLVEIDPYFKATIKKDVQFNKIIQSPEFKSTLLE